MLAAVLFYVSLIFLWSLVALWVAAFLWTRRALAIFETVTEKTLSLQSSKSKISVLLPARNEEKRVLKECLDSLLAQNYENFEVIAVNDRSTDQTGTILRRIANENTKLHFIEGGDLPADWLGKPFVLAQALEKATGEWILTTDADVIFKSPNALAAAAAFAEKNDLDALCLIPFVICRSFWETVFMPIFNWFRLLAMPPELVNDPMRAEKAMGIGNFFFVRRAALAQIGGFAVVRGDVAEDLRLAEILKKSKARIVTEYAPDLIETRMYSSFAEIWHGFTKNFFAGSNFSKQNAVFGIVSVVLFGALPSFAALFCLVQLMQTADSVYWLFLVPLTAVYLLQTVLFGFLNVKWELPIVYSLFAPLGLALFAAILLNSTIKIVSGRGVTWKGRSIYSRENSRSSVG